MLWSKSEEGRKKEAIPENVATGKPRLTEHLLSLSILVILDPGAHSPRFRFQAPGA
jgi:hypothetical protein